LPLSENQVSKCRPAGLVKAGDLTVEHGAFDSEVLGDPHCKLGESAKDVIVSRNEFAVASVNVCERPKAIDF